jgi:hypothetical protein
MRTLTRLLLASTGRKFAIPGVIAALTVTLSPAQALTINPIFGNSITTAVNAAAVEGAINSAITTIDGLYINNVAINVDFSYNAAGGGNLLSTNQFYYDYSYANYTTALKADATANPLNTTLALAVANLSVGNDANGAKDLALTYAQALMLSAYGLSAPSLPPSNSAININSIQPFVFSGAVDGSSYDAIGGLEHEIEEVIGGGGAGSTLNSVVTCSNSFFCTKVGATDLYRYSGNGTPSFITDPNAAAYLSVDGGATKIVGFNQNSGGDFGDFSPACGAGVGGQVIQNAFNCTGPDEPYTKLSPEFVMSQAIGWDSAAPPPVNTVPEPNVLAILIIAIGGIGLVRRRSTAVAMVA